MIMKTAMRYLASQARTLKQEIITVRFALKHPACPWHARILAAALTAYALSPIDLIPDFIPILGYLDEMVVLPAGIWLLLRLLPQPLLKECGRKSAEHAIGATSLLQRLPGLMIVVGIWVLAIVWTVRSLA